MALSFDLSSWGRLACRLQEWCKAALEDKKRRAMGDPVAENAQDEDQKSQASDKFSLPTLSPPPCHVFFSIDYRTTNACISSYTLSSARIYSLYKRHINLIEMFTTGSIGLTRYYPPSIFPMFILYVSQSALDHPIISRFPHINSG